MSLMDKRLLGHGQKVYRHFVESFPGLHSGKGQGEGFPGQDLKLWTGLQCWSTHVICLAGDPGLG